MKADLYNPRLFPILSPLRLCLDTMEEKFAIDNGLRNTNQNDRADTLDENMDDNTAAQDHLRRKMDRHLMPLVFVLCMWRG